MFLRKQGIRMVAKSTGKGSLQTNRWAMSSSSAAVPAARPPPRCWLSTGCKVTLFERDHFPRFHIGESLIPETFWVLKRLGMIPKMQGSHFVKKYSVQFITSKGKLSEPFYFWDHKPHESSQTWQVRRSEFDKLDA